MSAEGVSIRGEVQIEICGKSLSLAPTFRAIEAIEVRLGVGIPHLMARAMSGDIRIRDLAVIVHEGLKGAGHTGRNGSGDVVPIEQVGEDVMDHLSRYCEAVGAFLGNALGGRNVKKETAP